MWKRHDLERYWACAAITERKSFYVPVGQFALQLVDVDAQ